jgi:hypothetical protein
MITVGETSHYVTVLYGHNTKKNSATALLNAASCVLVQCMEYTVHTSS